MKNYPNKKLENYRRRATFTASGRGSGTKTEMTETSKIILYIFAAIVGLMILGGSYYYYNKFYKGKQIEVVQPISTFVKALLR